MKKLTAILLAAVMMLSCIVIPASADAAFPDIANATYAGAIELLKELKVVGGDDKGNFNPTAAIKRSEFAKMVYVIYTGTNDASAYTKKSAFPDVADNAWFNGYVNWATENKIIGGYDDGTFKPDESVTIEQVIKMLVVAISGEPAEAVFPDSYIAAGKTTGLYNGLYFGQTNVPATRELVAQFIMNAIFENSKILSASPKDKFFASAKAPVTELKILVGTYNWNLLDVKGGAAMIIMDDEIVLGDFAFGSAAEFQDARTVVTTEVEAEKLDALLGAPVIVTYEDDKKDNVVDIKAAAEATFAYGYQIVSTETGVKVGDKEMAIDPTFGVWNQVYQSATWELRYGREGKVCLADNYDDECHWIYDLDGDGDIDYVYMRPIYNGMLIGENTLDTITGAIKTVTQNNCSYTWGDSKGNNRFYRQRDPAEEIKPGDWVEGYITCNDMGLSTFVIWKCKTVTGKVSDITLKLTDETAPVNSGNSEVWAGTVKLDGVEYSFCEYDRTDNKQDNGRAALAAAKDGDVFTFVLTESGLVSTVFAGETYGG